MAPTSDVKQSGRRTLTRERVLEGAVALADEVGLDDFTIRKLATALDVKPMTIYHHVPSKEAIVDGMVELVFGEIELPPTDIDWKTAIGRRARSARAVLARHPWAPPLMESRTTPGPEMLEHHDAVVGCFRRGGFSVELAGHAYALLDSFIYGFALQEASRAATEGEAMDDLAEDFADSVPEGDYPHLLELTREYVLQPGYDFAHEFDFGLNLILDGLQADLSD